MTRKQIYLQGAHDGIPIAIGYAAVAFTIGIAAARAGFTPLQAAFNSFLTHASAGEFIGLTMCASGAGIIETAIMLFVANARYMLMGCSLGQKLPREASLGARLIVGFGLTDEIFGISIAREGKLSPFYSLGAMSVALPGWSFGTLMGASAGSILPSNITEALGMMLYGMFLYIIIPISRKQKLYGVIVAVSFAASFIASRSPLMNVLSSGTVTILLTVIISLVFAVLFPVEGEWKIFRKKAGDADKREKDE